MNLYFIWQRNAGPYEDIQETETLKLGFPLQYDGKSWPEIAIEGWRGVYVAQSQNVHTEQFRNSVKVHGEHSRV